MIISVKLLIVIRLIEYNNINNLCKRIQNFPFINLQLSNHLAKITALILYNKYNIQMIKKYQMLNMNNNNNTNLPLIKIVQYVKNVLKNMIRKVFNVLNFIDKVVMVYNDHPEYFFCFV